MSQLKGVDGGLWVDAARSVTNINKPFWVQITGAAVNGRYPWREVYLTGLSPLPVFAVLDGRSGTVNVNPLIEVNGAALTTNSFVCIRREYYDETYDWVYAVVSGSGSAGPAGPGGSGVGGGVGGSGIAPQLALWAGPSANPSVTLGNSSIADDGTIVFFKNEQTGWTWNGQTLLADANDYNPDIIGPTTLLDLSPTNANRKVTGFTNSYYLDARNIARFLIVKNSSSTYNLTLAHNSTLSALGNRIFCPGAVDLVLAPGQSAILIWDAGALPSVHWFVIGHTSTFGNLTGTIGVPSLPTMPIGVTYGGTTSISTFFGVSIFSSWIKFTIPFGQWNAASTTQTLTLWTVPAGCVIDAVKIKHSVAFAGPGYVSYKIDVGAGSLVSTTLIQNFDAFTAVAETAKAINTGNAGLTKFPFLMNHSSTDTLTATATSAGGNLSAATAGSVDIWVKFSVAP